MCHPGLRPWLMQAPKPGLEAEIQLGKDAPCSSTKPRLVRRTRVIQASYYFCDAYEAGEGDIDRGAKVKGRGVTHFAQAERRRVGIPLDRREGRTT